MRRPDLPLWWSRAVRLVTGAGGTLIAAVTAVIRNKWLAQHLDTTGIGSLSQIISGQTWLGTAAGLGLSLPVARAVGAASGEGADAEAGRRAAWSAALLATLAGVIVVAAGLMGAPFLSRALLGTPDYAPMVRLSMLGVAGIAIWTPVQGFFAGRSDLRAPLTFALAGSGGATIAVFLLVPRFGLRGAVMSFTLLYPLGLVATLLAHAPSHAAAIRPRPRALLATALREAGPLLSVSGAALALLLIDLGTIVGLRAHYLRANGVASNGLAQAALSLSQQIGGIFYAYMAGYAFGKVNAVATTNGSAGVRDYTRRHWTPLFLLAFFAVIVASLTASPLLHVLYSARFDAARPLMALTLWGELGRVAVQTVAIGALAVGGTRLWFAIGITQPVALAAAYALVARQGAGAMSLPLAYAAAGWATFAVALLLLRRHGVTLRGRTLVLTGIAFVAQALLVRWIVGWA